MKGNKIYTPIGVRDILPAECGEKNNIITNIKKVFNSYGYESVETPTFEYMSVFDDDVNTSGFKNAYKLVDREGQLLVLRPDMTPPICRMTSLHFADKKIPLRFSYFGNSFSYTENFQGKLIEKTDGGVELIGDYSIEADTEVIYLAIKSVLASGLKDFMLEVCHVDFLIGVMEEGGFSDETIQIIKELIAERDLIGVMEVVDSLNVSDHIKNIFSSLEKLVGGVAVLDYAKTITASEKSLQAIERLKSIYDLLCCYGIEAYISFDLSMLHKNDYYTGIIFRGYTYDMGFYIVVGGRYDKLFDKFSYRAGAVGFCARINNIHTAIKRQGIELQYNKVATLICFTKEGRKAAYKLGDELRDKGVYAENSFIIDDLEKNITYAKEKEYGGILFFKNDYQVNIINLQDGSTTVVNIDELLTLF